jgi:hypothetical protein
MNRISVKLAFLCMVIFFGFLGTASAGEDLKPAAIRDLQGAVVKALPTEGHILRIAVLDFDGDDGTIKNAVISAIAEKTTYKIIERADLDQILKEQGLQLKDIMDEKTRIPHGRIKGVQGLIMGKVHGMESGFMSYTIKLHLKLDDVEKGEILFSRDFTVMAVSPLRKWLIIAGVAVMVALFLLPIIMRRRVEVKERVIKEDAAARTDLAKDISKAMASLSEARARLMDKGNTDGAVLVKDAERELLLLREQVENAMRGDTEMRSKKELQEVLDFDRKMEKTFENLAATADRFYQQVLSGSTGNTLGQQADTLKKEIKNAANDFKGRNI